MTAPPDRRKRERLTPQLTTGHQQLHARCFQKGIRHIHAVGHHNRILMVAQLTGNLIRRGTGVQNHTQPRPDKLGGHRRNIAFDSGVAGTFIFQ